jgi:flagellar hook-associated protein FlgK
MQTARQGAEVAGHNLANASNPIYARQRVKIAAAVAIPTDKGPQGSGSEVARLEQIRDYSIDKAIVMEKSVTKYLETKQRQLRRAEASLGQTLDRQNIDAGESYGSYGVAEGLTNLFNSFQSLSANPTSSAERQTVLFNAQKLADKMNIVDRRLGDLRSSINEEQDFETDNVNAKIEEVAVLAASVGNTEIVEGAANEIRDSMQAAIEDLSELVNISTTTNENGKLSLFIAGYEMITDNSMTGSVKIHTDSNGMNFMADNKTGDVLTLQSGSVKGLIDVRDGSIKNLRDQLNSLASELISLVNKGTDGEVGPTDGLIAHYPLAGSALEITGNGTDGTVSGATLTADRAGRTDKAYNFDGVDDSINLGNSNITGAFTVSGWLNLDSTEPNWATLYAADGTGMPHEINLTAHTDGRVRLHVGGVANYVETPAGALAKDKWSHVSGSWDGTTAKIYIDGSAASTSVNGTLENPDNTTAFIGKTAYSPDDHVKGQIGDVRIYDRALTDTEVKELQQVTPLAGHDDGKGLNGTTGEVFFTGSGASDIGVNENLINDPRKLQATDANGEAGGNEIIRNLANLGQIGVAGLDGMNAAEHYGNTISRFGQDMALTDTQLIDQTMVQTMLEKQRDSVQGVSIDEEVANLIIYQRAFQASARLISTMDTLMNDVLNLQR